MNLLIERDQVDQLGHMRIGKGSVARRLLDHDRTPSIALTALTHKVLHPSAPLVIWCMGCYPEVLERSGSLVVLDEAMEALARSRYLWPSSRR